MSASIKTRFSPARKALVSTARGNALQRSAIDGSQLSAVPPIVREVLRSPGQPLDAETRAFMEPRFGHDFSRVRVHTDGAAAESARAVNAFAYTVGRDVVFEAGEYAPSTWIGRNLLAHELTHTIQQGIGPIGNLADAEQEADQAADGIHSNVHNDMAVGIARLGLCVAQQQDIARSTQILMRRGRTVGGFFANLFQLWDYSKKTLDAYLADLDRTNQIQGDDDSDDMARQIVAEWKENKSKYRLTPKIKKLLVREMLDGVVADSDQEGVMDLLEGSDNSDLKIMFQTSPNPLIFPEIHTKFDSLKPRLELFNKRVLKNLDRLKSPETDDAKSVERRLQEVEKKSGIGFKDLSISFRVAPGILSKSFRVNLTVPPPGVFVTITLTRSRLRIRIEPSILVDVVWPIPNAQLSGFTLTFAGLKTKLDIAGIGFISAGAQEQVDQYLKGLLTGTRFEDPAYNPINDPQLIGELMDPSVFGDINRIKYNFEKKSEKSEGDPKIAQDVSDLSISLNLVHKAGLPIPSEGWGIVIPRGTKFNLQIQTRGTASELMKKNLRLERLRIVTDGIYLFKGRDKIAMLTSLDMDRGLEIKLGGVKSFVDLKALLRREFPGKFTDAVTGYMKDADILIDTMKDVVTLGGILGDPGPKSDIAQSLAVKASEKVLGWVVGQALSEHWSEIQGALGVTDKQLEEFFGL
jgi:hypothetical protein